MTKTESRLLLWIGKAVYYAIEAETVVEAIDPDRTRRDSICKHLRDAVHELQLERKS